MAVGISVGVCVAVVVMAWKLVVWDAVAAAATWPVKTAPHLTRE